ALVQLDRHLEVAGLLGRHAFQVARGLRLQNPAVLERLTLARCSSRRHARVFAGSSAWRVGERGFEPPAPTSQTWCSAWLSYSPEWRAIAQNGWLSVAIAAVAGHAAPIC